VRTFVMPFDPVVLAQALMRERLSRRPELLRSSAH